MFYEWAGTVLLNWIGEAAEEWGGGVGGRIGWEEWKGGVNGRSGREEWEEKGGVGGGGRSGRGKVGEGNVGEEE